MTDSATSHILTEQVISLYPGDELTVTPDADGKVRISSGTHAYVIRLYGPPGPLRLSTRTCPDPAAHLPLRKRVRVALRRRLHPSIDSDDDLQPPDPYPASLLQEGGMMTLADAVHAPRNGMSARDAFLADVAGCLPQPLAEAHLAALTAEVEGPLLAQVAMLLEPLSALYLYLSEHEVIALERAAWLPALGALVDDTVAEATRYLASIREDERRRTLAAGGSDATAE